MKKTYERPQLLAVAVLSKSTAATAAHKGISGGYYLDEPPRFEFPVGLDQS
jgi:hypothetical protein